MHPTHMDGVAVPGSNSASAADQAPGEDLETPLLANRALDADDGPWQEPERSRLRAKGASDLGAAETRRITK